MSLQRTGNQDYREYLRSQAWGWRRKRWFRDCRAKGFEPACQVCQLTLKKAGSLDLHHVSYEGVQRDENGKWHANEDDGDLMPMCRGCHEQLHYRMDGPGEFRGWDRRRATVVIIRSMRATYQKGRAAWLAG